MSRRSLVVAGLALLAVAQLPAVPSWGDITVDPDNVGATDVLHPVGGEFVPLTNPVADPLDIPLLAVGQTGNGVLAVTDGSRVSTGHGRIGWMESADGLVSIDGPGSSWTTNQFYVGFAGNAELNVTGGGQVVANWPVIADRTSSVATVTIDGPGSLFTPSGYNSIRFGRGSVTLNLRNGGEFHFSSGMPHWLELLPLELDANDTINLDGGVLDMHFGDIYKWDGEFRFTGGVLRHVRQFRGDLYQQGGRIEFYSWPNIPFDTAIGGDYTIDPTGTLEMDALATVRVGRTATLSGTLDAYWPDKIYLPRRDDGLIEINPEIGDTFTVLTATDGVVGRFDNVLLPNLAGNRIVTWAVQYNPSDVTLEIMSSIFTGDFNEDGAVDTDDFLIWKNGYGTIIGVGHADGDANLDGFVDGDDFLIWQAQFGMTAVGGSASVVAVVPEPAAGILALLVAAITYALAARWAI